MSSALWSDPLKFEKMSDQQNQQQFDDVTENDQIHITTLSSASPFESLPPHHHLLLGDLSHLQQVPLASNHHNHYHQQQKGHPSYFPGEDGDEEDEHEDSKSPINSPFSPHCRIPLPDFTFGYNGPGGILLAHHLDTGTFIRRRNERERTRVRNVNEGFERLRAHLPPLFTPANSGGPSCSSREGRRSSSTTTSTSTSTSATESRRLSKVETLRLAIAYIKQLQEALRN